MKYCLSLLLVLVLFGCQQETTPDGPLKYFPKGIENGLVWKYYFVEKEHKSDHPIGDINYRKMKLTGTHMHVSEYNAEFKLTKEYELNTADSIWKLTKYTDYIKDTRKIESNTTLSYQVLQDQFINWKGSQATKEVMTTVEGYTYYFGESQLESVDKQVEDRAEKHLKGERFVIVVSPQDTTKTELQWSRVYAEELGMTQWTSMSEYTEYSLTLDEIITIDEFERRQDHGMKRVAYIDPSQVMDADSGFKTCGAYEDINDYYNGRDKIAQFKGGKGRLWQVLDKKLDKSLLKGVSGYLTYRFIINCKGQAGNFIQDGCDLAFEKIDFPKGLVEHLYSILKEEKEWTPIQISNREHADAYTYITFKMQDGKLIEILP